jgi:hypothetical protein
MRDPGNSHLTAIPSMLCGAGYYSDIALLSRTQRALRPARLIVNPDDRGRPHETVLLDTLRLTIFRLSKARSSFGRFPFTLDHKFVTSSA